jgi:GTP cyclohydrolase III
MTMLTMLMMMVMMMMMMLGHHLLPIIIGFPRLIPYKTAMSLFNIRNQKKTLNLRGISMSEGTGETPQDALEEARHGFYALKCGLVIP